MRDCYLQNQIYFTNIFLASIKCLDCTCLVQRMRCHIAPGGSLLQKKKPTIFANGINQTMQDVVLWVLFQVNAVKSDMIGPFPAVAIDQIPREFEAHHTRKQPNSEEKCFMNHLFPPRKKKGDIWHHKLTNKIKSVRR